MKRLTGLLILALAAALAPSARASHDGPLAGQWHLDEPPGNGADMRDSSGHGNDGSSSFADSIAGRWGSALGFDGDVGRVVVPDSAALAPERVTVLAWARRTDQAPPANAYIVARGAEACTGAAYALYTGPAGGAGFYVQDAGGVRFESPRAPAGLWSDGSWHAVAGVYDGARVRLYVDGREIGDGTAGPEGSVDYDMTDGRLVIGGYPLFCQNLSPFRGGIDEVRVYDRALTAGEVAALQTANGPQPPVLGEAPGSPTPTPTATATPSPTPGSGNPAPGPGPAGPVPAVVPVLTTAASQVVRGTWISAATSIVPAGVAVAAYDWDLNRDGIFELPCSPETAAISTAFKTAGTKAVGLRITDTLGRAATAITSIVIPTTEVNRARGAESVATCENPGAGNQPDRTDCVKSFAFGIVQVNSRGGTNDCFKLERRIRARRDVRAAQIRGPVSSYAYYHASVRGPVAINGLYVPVPAAATTEYDSGDGTIGVGKLSLRFGPYTTEPVNLSQTIQPDRFGRYRLALPTLKAPKILDFLPVQKVGGHIDLIKYASLSTVMVGLPNIFTFRARGEPAVVGATIRSDNVRGADLDGVQIGPIPEMLLGPLSVSDLAFLYSRTDETWRSEGALGLVGASPVVLDAAPPPAGHGFGMTRGQFAYAGAHLDFSKAVARPVLFPGITLGGIGVGVGVNPFRLSGDAKIFVGELAEVSGAVFLGFATKSTPYDFPTDKVGPELAALSGRRLDTTTLAVGGTASIRVPGLEKLFPALARLPLFNMHLIYMWPGYVEYAGGVSLKDKDGYFSIEGGMQAFGDAEAKTFNLEGQVMACLKEPVKLCPPKVGAVVSSKGLGFCTIVPIPTPFGPVPVPAGIGYKWGDSLPDVMVFSCSIDDYREVSAHTSQAGGSAFTVPADAPSLMVKVRGTGGPPRVVVTGPKGERIEAGADLRAYDRHVVIVPLPAESATLVALDAPAAGSWTVAAAPGSPAIASLATALGRATPSVRATVRRGVVHYTVAHGEGWRITLAEQGARTFHELGRATGSRGRIRFVPAAGRRERRQIVARLELGGVPARTIVAGAYRAPAAAGPGRPGRVRAVRRRGALVVRWNPVAGAARYAVTVVPARGERALRTTRRPRLTLAGAPAGRLRVLVSALDGGGITGPPARVRVR